MPLTYQIWVASLDLTDDCRAATVQRRLHNFGESPAAGEATIIIDNDIGSLSPQSNSDLVPNAAVRIMATDTDTTTPYEIFNGFAKNYATSPAYGKRALTVFAKDRAKFFGRQLETPMSVDTDAKSLYTEVFSSLGMAGVHSINPALVDQIPYASYDDLQGQTALTEIAAATGSRVFVSKDGIVRVIDRNSLVSPRAVSSFIENFNKLAYTLTDEGVKNDVRISSTPRKQETSVATLSYLEDVPAVAAGEEIEFFMVYRDPVTEEDRTPANSVVPPVSTTDWLINAASDGGGADLTASGSVTASLFTKSAKVTVRNTSGSDGFLTKMQLRGYPLRLQPTFTKRTQISSSQDAYDRQVYTLSTELIETQEQAENLGRYLALLWKDPQSDIRVGPEKNIIDPALAPELGEAIHVVDSMSGVGSSWTINRITHTIDMEVGQQHSVEFGCDYVVLDQFLVLDNAVFGKLDVGRLAF